MVAADLKNVTPKYVRESGVAGSSPLAHRGKSGTGRTWSWTGGLKPVHGIRGSSDGLSSAQWQRGSNGLWSSGSDPFSATYKTGSRKSSRVLDRMRITYTL